MEEIWRDIKGFEGLYQVSNLGRVKSLEQILSFGIQKRIKPEMILKPVNNGKDYLFVNFRRKDKKRYIHRLVAEAFIPNPDNKSEVDHINTIRTDNRVENLRWATTVENSNNPITKQNQSGSNHPMFGRKGINSPTSKPVLQFDLNGVFIKRWDCAADIKRELKYNASFISMCCKNIKEKAYGFKWKFE